MRIAYIRLFADAEWILDAPWLQFLIITRMKSPDRAGTGEM
jgi:hypothetical protein